MYLTDVIIDYFLILCSTLVNSGLFAKLLNTILVSFHYN